MAAAIRLSLPQWSGLGCGNIAWPDAVALDVVLAVFAGDVAGQHLQPTLCSCIRTDRLASQFAHHRTDIDDFTAFAFHHRRKDGLGDDERSGKVDIDDLAPIACCHLVHRDALDDAGVVDQDVDRPQILDDPLIGPDYCILIGYVAHIAFCIDSCLLVGIESLVNQFLIDVIECNLCSSLRIHTGDCKPDPITGSGNPGHLSLQGEHILHFCHIVYLNSSVATQSISV